MPENHSPQPASTNQRQQPDPSALLASLVPRESAERRRAIAALLRALVDDGANPGGA